MTRTVEPGTGELLSPQTDEPSDRRTADPAAERRHSEDEGRPGGATAETAGTSAVIEPDDDPGRGAFLHWSGRRAYRARVPAPRVLETVGEFSDPVESDPGNLVIEGDNLQAMVSLRGQFARQVNVVLIDPPYNTGKNDFRYSDRRFHDPNADDSKGDFVRGEHGGRHTMWLNTMAPRLAVIRDLMADDGVIFVHINDIELPRLLLLMEDVFDEANRLGTLIWKGATDNNPSQIITEHEYILVWAKHKELVPSPWTGRVNDLAILMWDEFNRLKGESHDLDELRARWRAWVRAHKAELPNALGRKTEVDARGPYQPDGNLTNPGRRGYYYDVLHPVTGKPVKVPLLGWRFPPESMNRLIEADMITWPPDHTRQPGLKYYLGEDASDRLRSVIELDNRGAAYDIARLFPENPNIFKNPKPTALEELLLSFAADKDAIVLDAFAGSGTTGHAVMRLNAEDDGRRRFILIEEGNGDDAFAATLTAERLRRARIAEELPGGFTFYRIGQKIDRDAFLVLQRESIVAAIRQSDASGRGGGIKPANGTYVIASNRRRQAIALVWRDQIGHVTVDAVRAIFDETKSLGLTWPIRVYGTSCEVEETDDFRFFRLPDEVIANLTVGLGSGG